MSILIRPDIASLKPYESHVIEGNIKMDANENPFPWPEGMREELLNSKIDFNRYPDGEGTELREVIAAYNGINKEEVLVGNGSDELIQLVLQTFGGRDRALMIHPPTFSMYRAGAMITGTPVIEIPLLDGTGLDGENILRVSEEDNRQKVIILCNPNNPTGAIFPRKEILRIVQNTKDLVIVDEAYFEFSKETLIDQINEYSNLLVMRTFSKAFGMAALRIGYVAGNRGLITSLNKVRQPYNVNSFSQKAGVIALKYVSPFKSQVEILIKETQNLYNELNKVQGFTVLPTKANFLLVKYQDAEYLTRELSLRGFSVRYFRQLPGLGEAFRMSAGTPEENKAFLETVKDIINTQ